MKQLTEEEFKKYYEKYSVMELSKLLGRNRITIYRWARKLNLPLKKTRLIKK